METHKIEWNKLDYNYVNYTKVASTWTNARISLYKGIVSESTS